MSIMFHHFHGGIHPHRQGSLSAEDLAALIEYTDGQTLLTFDDTLRSAFDIALPVLNKYGLKGHWFVSSALLQGSIELEPLYSLLRDTRFPHFRAFAKAFFEPVASELLVEWRRAFYESNYLAAYCFYTDEERFFRFVRDEFLRPEDYHQLMWQLLKSCGVDLPGFYNLAYKLWMQPEHIQELHRQGHTIGLHSHSHRQIGKLSLIEQYVEYRTNRDYLAGLLGEAPCTMSHPFNSYNKITLWILASLGICEGYRANTASCDYGPLELPREDCADVLREIQDENNPVYKQRLASSGAD